MEIEPLEPLALSQVSDVRPALALLLRYSWDSGSRGGEEGDTQPSSSTLALRYSAWGGGFGSGFLLSEACFAVELSHVILYFIFF